MRVLHSIVAALGACAALASNAGVGLSQLPAPVESDAPVTVYYPTATPDQAVQRGPFTLQVAPDAPPTRGNGRLVIVSHGSGGNAWVHADLARTLVDAGFVVAMPEHQGDNARDFSDAGPASWKRRPAEVSRAIDAVQHDARFAPLLTFDRVGMFGMSAGGHTALSLAGGRWSPARLRDHCMAHLDEDFQSCVGLATRLRGDVFDRPKKAIASFVIRHRLDDERWYTHDDPRIAAVVAGVPFAVDFDSASLATPRVPLALITSGRDAWLTPRFHSGPILLACLPRCELLADMPTAGHAALLSPPPPPQVLGPLARDLLSDPPGFDRGELPAVNARIAAFFRRHLLSLE
ncbi:alpha/beta hydrolase family protein [Ramlibacter sp. MMS24-I3-19]|uniref:alpha/beta hydrolase family protein n=1 Tax=Ramlibacter sp. MMS24-I3-19 TaxID=3416606 RepID=UPI003D08A031